MSRSPPSDIQAAPQARASDARPRDRAAHAAGGLHARLGPIHDPLALLESLFEHSPVPYAIFDLDGHHLTSNPAYGEMFGKGPPPEYSVLEDEIGVRLGLAGLVRRAFDGEAVQTPPIWYDPKDLPHFDAAGARRVAISCNFFPLRDRDGALAYVGVAYKDVTADLDARERAESELARLRALADEKDRLATALADSDERLRATLEAADVGTWEWNIADNHVQWSPNIDRIFGLEHGTFRGTYEASLELVHPADRMMLAEKIGATLETQAPYTAEFRFLRPDGSTGWLSARGYVIAGETGQPRLLRGVIFDVTARRAAEDALKRPAQVLENMTEGVNLSDEHGIILYTNPAYDRMFGYPRGGPIGQHVTLLNAYPPAENERVVAEVMRQLREG